VKPFYISSETVLPIECNRSTHRVYPFYPSSETVIPVECIRSTCRVKPFYPQTVLPFKRTVRRYSLRFPSDHAIVCAELELVLPQPLQASERP
jgi:hypothetical protein